MLGILKENINDDMNKIFMFLILWCSANTIDIEFIIFIINVLENTEQNSFFFNINTSFAISFNDPELKRELFIFVTPKKYIKII